MFHFNLYDVESSLGALWCNLHEVSTSFAILQGLSAPKKGKQLACIMSMTFVSGRQRTEPTQQTVQSVRNQVTFIILNSKLINSELEAHIAH